MRLSSMRNVVAGLAVMLVAASCGGDDRGAPNDSVTTPSSPATSSPSTPQPSPSLDDLGELVGVPEAGVENDCWLLDDFLLLGGDRELIASGEELRVTGQIDKNMMTTCQQGTPFVVEDVEPVD